LTRTRALTALAAASVLGFVLACSGSDDVSAEAAAEAALDAEDPAEVARRAANYAEAERLLNMRLNADPNDARSWRLLGDVNFSRGQRYREKWQNNLVWAREKYTHSLTVDPTNCVTWGRLATAVVAAAENEVTRATPEELLGLPLADGWEACGGAPLLALEMAREPNDSQLTAARRELTSSATWGELQAAAAPWQKQAIDQAARADRDWRDLLVRPEPAGGGTFVVLDLPVTASGVKGAKPRSFTYPEWLSIGSVSGDRLVFRDRRFPERIPSSGRVLATACPGTKWNLDGPDNLPVGTCTAGRYDRTQSPVYDPDRLRKADLAFYHHPSISEAEIPWVDIADDSILCKGGPVGRRFEEIPSCEVSYDRAIPQTRSIPADVGLSALDQPHGEKMVQHLRAEAFWGPELADHLGRSRVALGMSYPEFVAAWPDLRGCMGRAVYQRSDIVDGAFEFTCTLSPWDFTFRDLTLIDIRASEG
jgi:hypothetical protein